MLSNKPNYFWKNLQVDGGACLSSRQVGTVELSLANNGGAIVTPVREVTRVLALPNMGGVMIDVEYVRG